MMQIFAAAANMRMSGEGVAAVNDNCKIRHSSISCGYVHEQCRVLCPKKLSEPFVLGQWPK